MTRSRVLAVAGVGAVAALMAFRPRPADYPSAIAREAPFGDSVIETGTLSAARLAVYSAPSGNTQAKILELVPEGTYVHAGDRLIRFDTSALEQDLARERAARQSSGADEQQAINDFKVEQLRLQTDYDSASVRVDSAESALANQVDGQGRLDLAEADAAAADAAKEAAHARKAFEDLKPLLERGFITKAELDRAEQAAAKADTTARLANMRAQTIASYQRPAAIAKARAEVGIAKDTLGRQRDIAAARLQQAQTAVNLAVTRMAQSDARIAALEATIAASTVAAEGPGLVMYRDVFFGADRRKPQVGDTASPNQPLLAVPDTSKLIVETRVREIDVTRVAQGRPATVRIDALPDTAVRATVSLVGALALDDPARTGTRYFPVTVTVDGHDARLRPGMTARVEMPSVTMTRAVVVPLQAVFDRDGERYVVVFADGGWQHRTVSVAAMNETEAAIAAGVRPGERVALVDPDAKRLMQGGS